MSTITAKKPKKEKSSKKIKSSDIAPLSELSPDAEAVPKLSSKRSRKSREDNDETPIAKSAPAITEEENEGIEADGPPAKKRKSSVDEIEVDITAPEPPSRKALRLLKKGKPLPPSKSGAESSPEPEAAKAKKAEVEKRSEHGIWIGNLAFTVSKDELRKFFVENSDITDDAITRIHMPSPDDKKPANKVMGSRSLKAQQNTGFAYVDFSTAEAVEQAVELSEQLLTGRQVLIKNNKSFEGRPLKTKEETRMEGKPPNKRVFVGNLRFDMTTDALNEHFEKCGAIATSFLATFEDSGKCKGYGWITFEDLESAKNAVRGFVLVPQQQEDSEEEDEEEEADSDADSDAEAATTKRKSKDVPMRRQYINMIQRRPVRVEFAEDAQTRYKKQYGGKGKGKKGEEATGEEKTERPAKVIPTKTPVYRNEYAPRLTGGIVESKGKKVVF